MDKHAIEECLELSFADAPFPEVIRRLSDAGVRAYHADLIQLQKTYYDGDRKTVAESLPLKEAPRVGDAFDPGAVVDALRAIQGRNIGYAEFLRRIMRGGCASYDVFLAGRKAIYFGRDGQSTWRTSRDRNSELAAGWARYHAARIARRANTFRIGREID